MLAHPMLCHSEPVTTLIVEDDPLLGRVLERVLTCDGQTALHVHESGQAMRLLNKLAPRLVLIDACLRDGTALTLLEAICTNHPGLPVILLTAHRFDQSGLPACVHQVVTKSIDLPELRRTVEAALCEERARPVRGTPDPAEVSGLPILTEPPVHATSESR